MISGAVYGSCDYRLSSSVDTVWVGIGDMPSPACALCRHVGAYMNDLLDYSPRISVCIATFKRQALLRILLDDLIQQTCPFHELVVVDNDADASAREVVRAFEEKVAVSAPRVKTVYAVQPQKNISITRNRTVELATGDWLAFLDDDERVTRDWLRVMIEACAHFNSDGALGSFVPAVPQTAAAWIRRGRFYDWYRMSTGVQVPAKALRFGNVILRGDVLRSEVGPFDPAYGVTGGEDGDLLSRLVQKGVKLVWCDEEPVIEPIEEKRLSAKWLWMRALRGGQDFATHSLRGRYGRVNFITKLAFLSRATMQIPIAALFALVLLPFGLHRSMYWVFKVAANYGKLSKFWGSHYQEYA